MLVRILHPVSQAYLYMLFPQAVSGPGGRHLGLRLAARAQPEVSLATEGKLWQRRGEPPCNSPSSYVSIQERQEDPGKPALVTGPQSCPFLSSPAPSSHIPAPSLTPPISPLEVPIILSLWSHFLRYGHQDSPEVRSMCCKVLFHPKKGLTDLLLWAQPCAG